MLIQIYPTISDVFERQQGKRMQDVWEFKDPQYPVYPTEKNIDMLDLIIRTSSNPQSYVLDCFCGSGTTLKSAQINNRNWIGVDQSLEAINATKKKLKEIENDLFVNNIEFAEIEFSSLPSTISVGKFTEPKNEGTRIAILPDKSLHRMNYARP